MNRRVIQLGFVLMLLALLTGLIVPAMVNPRLGLAAHVVGMVGGLVIIALGALAPAFALGRRSAAAMHGCWVYAAYANWLASVIGGLTGASRFTPIAGAGTSGSGAAEVIVGFLLASLSAAAIVGTTLAVRGFRRVENSAVVASPVQP
jgi:hydroxylaminobenzene mutase